MSSFGVADWCLDANESLSQAFAHAQHSNAKYLHVGIRDIADITHLRKVTTVGELKRTTPSVDVTCIALNAVERRHIIGRSRTHSDVHHYAVVVEAGCRLANELSAHAIYVPSFGAAEIRCKNDLCETAELLQMAATIGAEHGLLVASENSLDAFGCEELCHLVQRDNFRILFDVYNPLRWNHDPIEIVERCSDYFLKDIHVKDGFLPRFGCTRVGSGDGDVGRTLMAVLRKGTDWRFILENDYTNAGGLSLKEDICALDSLITTSRLLPTPDIFTGN